jgi:hypothetical protein
LKETVFLLAKRVSDLIEQIVASQVASRSSTAIPQRTEERS